MTENKDNNATDNKDNNVDNENTENESNSEVNTEAYAFSADINQLLSLIINTFYSNKDIFLRELICNSSDALDKIRYKSLTDPDVLGNDTDLEISIIPDLQNKKLIIRDTGIGMSKDELINNLGTIAKSGTKAFMEMLKAGQDVNMIGQFGVGFYSAFLVADKVDVYSKTFNSDKCHLWSSTAGGSFTISEILDWPEECGRGTQIELYIKEGMENYLEEKSIRDIIRKHADFLDFTIKLWATKSVEEEVPIEEGEPDETDEKEEDEKEEEKKEGEADEKDEKDEKEESDEKKESDEKTEDDRDVTVEDVDEKEESSTDNDKENEKPKTKKITKMVSDWEPLNYQKPLWTRKPSEITDEEYASFYRALANDYDSHLAVKHFSVEGQIEFKSILYVPQKAPFDLYDVGMKKMDNIKLYVRKVFIMDKIEDLMPSYLCFIKGVVDSEDLPLNISRETLQQNKIIRVIRKHIIKKSIDLLSELSEDEEKYKGFYENFSKNIKLGIHEDHANKDKLCKLLRFNSSHDSSKLVSLDEYISRMKEGQEAIYYITGESLDSLKSSPFVETLNKRGYEVLYMTDAIDEYCMQTLNNYDDKKLLCITKENFELKDDEDTEAKFKARVEELGDLCTSIKGVLENSIEKVVVTKRLQKSPCALVTGQFGWTANMERLVKAQALQSNAAKVQSQIMMTRKTLEINPDHPIVGRLEQIYKSDKDSKTFRDSVNLLYDTALISSGFTLNEPSKYTDKINKLIALGLGVGQSESDSDTDDTLDKLDNNPSIEDETIEDDSTMEEID